MAVSALFSAGGRLCGSLESSLAFHWQFLGRGGSAAILPQSSKHQSLVEDLHNPQNPAINRALFLLAILLLLAAFWRGAFEFARGDCFVDYSCDHEFLSVLHALCDNGGSPVFAVLSQEWGSSEIRYWLTVAAFGVFHRFFFYFGAPTFAGRVGASGFSGGGR